MDAGTEMCESDDRDDGNRGVINEHVRDGIESDEIECKRSC